MWLAPLSVVAVAGAFLAQSGEPKVEAFLDEHWAHPIAPQGPPPADFSRSEASLDPAACARCHPGQHQDWKASRHSRTMGPGILWQFKLFGQGDSNQCMNCHAPLAEQKALVALDQGWPGVPDGKRPDHISPDLHRQGLACAACHVRGHQRFGPPSRTGARGDEAQLPHGGFTARSAFADSRFCATCHQFPEDGPRLNGKLRQDTHQEWLRSSHAERGTTCQSCHMPDRRHLWRGISDPEMVRQAVTVNTSVKPGDEGSRVRARIENAGAGHRFPTYLVPSIVARLLLVDEHGEEVQEIATHHIQWRTSVDLEREEFDTRLEPGEAFVLEGLVRSATPPGARLRIEFDVAPKEHYERMYQDMLERNGDKLDAQTLGLLRLALREAESSRYRVVIVDRPLGG